MGKKKSYSEGSIFSIPLDQGGYAIGLITRANRSVLLGNFIKQKFSDIPTLDAINLLFENPKQNLLIHQFGSLGLDKGEWQVLGKLNNWNRNEWPVPIFKRKIDLSDKYFVVYYDDDLKNSRDVVTDYSEELDKLPNDSLAGYGSMATKLSKMLG